MEELKMKKVPLQDLPLQYQTIKEELAPEIEKVLSSAAYILGPAVSRFEEDFAKYVGTKHCIGVGSGTDALHLALIAAGVKAGDEVITVSFTFVATAWAISYIGAKPVFVDIDPHSYTMDPQKLEAAITPKTKAVLPVHLYGHMCNMDEIMEICQRHNLALVEDAAQAHGSTYKGKNAGTFGVSSCFSFYPGKNLGAFGEAGGVCTDDDDTAAHLRRLRNHSQGERYYYDELGFNYRMDGIQGAILGVKLRHLPAWTASRHKVAHKYKMALAGLPGLILPEIKSWCESNWYVFVIQHPHRDELQKFISERGIESALHYPLPVHLQKAYAHLGYKVGDLPVSETVAKRCLTLPLFPEMTDEQIDQVTSAVREFCLK